MNHDSISSFGEATNLQKDLIKTTECIEILRHDVVAYSLENCSTKQEHAMNKSIGGMMCTLFKLQHEFTKYYQRKAMEDTTEINSCSSSILEIEDCKNKNNQNVEGNEENNISLIYSTPLPRTAKTPIRTNEFTVKQIELLTTEEFQKLPKYLFGRITMEAINRFIDTINTAITTKYTLVLKPKNTLKGYEYDQYLKYKNDQTHDMKGKTFLKACDIAAVNNRQSLDKASIKIMCILRHTKRIFEIRNNGVVANYIIN